MTYAHALQPRLPATFAAPDRRRFAAVDASAPPGACYRYAMDFVAAPTDISDEQLMLNYAAGDLRAFDALYARFATRLMRYLTRLVVRPAVAEELFQEVWQRAIDARARYQPSARFGAWLFRIAHHLAIDHIRREQPQTDDSVLVHFPDGSAAPLQAIEDEAQLQRLIAALDRLPAEQRAVVLLRAEGDLTLEEIAETMSCGRETIKSRLRYALAKLKEALR
jgi:RNA polymerase sigma-70 factor (ECF subfamily)